MTNPILRHTLTTIQYRFDKSVSLVSADFGEFEIGSGCRTPKSLINHMYAVLHGMAVFLNTEQRVVDSPTILGFEEEVLRFKKEIDMADKALSVRVLDVLYSQKLIQGPLSDILTHIGQLSMLSRLSGNPIPGEDFSAATL